jgi:hypothetical protein
MLEMGQNGAPVLDHVIRGTPNENIQHAVQRSDVAMPDVRTRHTTDGQATTNRWQGTDQHPTPSYPTQDESQG